MRKCDICHTPIPIGEKYCPKCGYKMPDSLKTNQAQNQPTPQTKIKKTYIEVKKLTKENGMQHIC